MKTTLLITLALLVATPASAQSTAEVSPASAPASGAASVDAASGPCERRHLASAAPDARLFDGPIALSYFDADTATGRRVCPTSEVSLGLRAGVVIDTRDFYGGIGAGGLLTASHALGPRRELFATLEFLRYDFITNAVIEATEVGLGQLTLGGSQVTFDRERFAGAVSVRLMVPTQTNSNALLGGAELGHAIAFHPSRSLTLHGYLGGGVTAGLSGVRSFPRFGGLLTAGVQYAPASWFAVALDLNGRVGGFTSYLAPTLGLRFRLYRGFGAELAASRPLLGTDRHDVVAGLRFGYRL